MDLRRYDSFLQRHDFEILPTVIILAVVIGFGASGLLRLLAP
jgi:hypothetical protein